MFANSYFVAKSTVIFVQRCRKIISQGSQKARKQKEEETGIKRGAGDIKPPHAAYLVSALIKRL